MLVDEFKVSRGAAQNLLLSASVHAAALVKFSGEIPDLWAMPVGFGLLFLLFWGKGG